MLDDVQPPYYWSVCGKESGMTTHNGVLVRKPRTCCGNGGDDAAFADDFDPRDGDVCEWGKWPQSTTPLGYAHDGACDFDYETASPTSYPTIERDDPTAGPVPVETLPPSRGENVPPLVRARGGVMVVAGASFVPEIYDDATGTTMSLSTEYFVISLPTEYFVLKYPLWPSVWYYNIPTA
jgi:hypothetical protein